MDYKITYVKRSESNYGWIIYYMDNPIRSGKARSYQAARKNASIEFMGIKTGIDLEVEYKDFTK